MRGEVVDESGLSGGFEIASPYFVYQLLDVLVWFGASFRNDPVE